MMERGRPVGTPSPRRVVSCELIGTPGLVSASVCSTGTVDEAGQWLNGVWPTGISSTWTPAPEPTFANGMPQPGPCEADAGRTHYLFHC